MKKNIFTLLAIITAQISFSQEYKYVSFPDSGAIWSEAYYYPEPAWPDTIVKPTSYERFTVNGEDTIIKEISYKKLYMFYDSVFDKSTATYVGGIREDENKRIYFKGDTVIHYFKPMIDFPDYKEIVLFDFSVNVGDTIWHGNFPDYDWLVVSSIDTIQIGDNLRRRINFQNRFWLKWIEGIGSIRGLLFTSGALPICGPYNYLICFKQNDEVLYFNSDYSECYPTGIEAKKNSYFDIKVFPNPSNENIMFSFGEQKIKRIQINDSMGRLCDSFDCKMQSDFLLSIEKYRPGIYFYVVTNKNGFKHTGKFVVQ